MINKEYIILIVVLVTIGSVYPASSGIGNIDFCVWGFPCNNAENDLMVNGGGNLLIDEIVILELIDNDNEFQDYNFTEEGSSTSSLYLGRETAAKVFFEDLEKVINVSRSNYSGIIEAISGGDEFDEIYELNMKLFEKRYTQLIDESSPTGEYIQNIGEIVMNGYQGDCDDYALMLYLIAKEKGLDVRYVIGISLEMGHAWIQIKIDGEWKEYDSTSDTICDGCISEMFDFVDYFEEGEDEDEQNARIILT